MCIEGKFDTFLKFSANRSYKRDAFWDDLEKSVQKKDDTLEHIFFWLMLSYLTMILLHAAKKKYEYVCVYFGALDLFFILATSI